MQDFLEIGFCFHLDGQEKKENTIVFEPEKTKAVLDIKLNYVLGLLAYINNLYYGITTSQPSTYFTCSFTANEQKKLYDGLIKSGFFTQRRQLQSFLSYVWWHTCTGQ
jgi:hypothetical protein